MPWQDVNRGSLALSLLTRILADHGVSTAVRYVNLEFASLIGEELYGRIAYMQNIPGLLFAPLVNGAAAAGGSLDEDNIARVATATGLSGAEVRRLVDVTIPEFVNDLAAEIKDHGAAVLGLSAVMSQLVPAAALADAVKRTHDCMTVVGGAAVFGTMGQAALEVYPGFDVAVLGEAERVIVPLVEALADGRPLDDVPGIAFRGSSAVHRTARTPGLTDLNSLPVPDFSDYVDQYRRQGFGGDPWLSIESSRGCWWGERSVCTFCGLNGETATYRMKSPERAAAELVRIHQATALTRFCATDNILADGKAGGALLRQYAKAAVEIPGLEMFFQTKSNLSRGKLAQARLAGITTLQPGVESFDSRILTRMRKGAKGIDQVRCIKLLTEAGMHAIYGILWGSVGDRSYEYEAQHRLLPSLAHLVPPSYVTPVLFERFSPYHENPGEHGIRLVPREMDDLLAPPGKTKFLPELSETFSIVHDDAEEAAAAARARMIVPRIEQAVAEWRDGDADCVYRVELDGRAGQLRDTRPGRATTDVPLSERECQILCACEVPQGRRTLLESLTKRWPSAAEGDLAATVDDLLARKLLLDLDKRLFTLPIRRVRHRIIGLAGPTCAGKTTAVSEAVKAGYEVLDVGEELARTYGAEVAAMDPVAKLSTIGEGRSVFLGLRDALHQKLRTGRPVVVDSVKSSSDVPVLRELVPGAGILVVGISAPSELRRQRFHLRNRSGDERSMDVKDRKLLSIGVDEVIGNVDVEIANDGNEKTYRGVLSRLFSLALGCDSLTFWCSGV
jgi:ribosomal peptide maturation radical SAM protein 1